ncbi:hypothetical protein EB118_01950 [bacterium]|nr:hypothetical protein [bacterium]NDC94180.1 hypothetical protein [bacterium]NDD83012.1 hypothetical protein [bacterium]NDG28850.1 hypothetical protein [bacterium]
MPPGIIQLQAKGDKDMYISENPQISVFKYNYYRSMNFAAETIVLPLNDNVNFGKATSCKIEKYGHLLSKLYLCVKLPMLTQNGGSYACWTDNIGRALFSKPIELEIGGVVVDYCYPQFLDMYSDLTESAPVSGRNLMTLKSDTYVSNQRNATQETDLIIPIEFWFTKNYTLALPLLAMYQQQVKLNMYFRDFSELVNYDGDEPDRVEVSGSQMLAEYIFLDDQIISDYQQNTHTYLIEQIHFQGNESIPANQPLFNTALKFTKPTKEIVFACVETGNIENNNYFVYSRSSDNRAPIKSATLLLDGSRRFDNLPEFYFRSVVPYAIHKTVPSKYIYCIPFSIRPEDNQPTGHFNPERFTDVTLNLNMTPDNPPMSIFIYGVCYTIVQIQNGVLTVAF